MSRIVAGLLLLTSACARYTPAPVSPESQLDRYNRRSLADSGLLAWLDTVVGARPSGPWTPRQLALASVWLRSDRQVRLAEIREADAAVVTAGGRPQAGVSSDLEYAFSDPQASSRWGLALAGLFTVELGGKRGARIGKARAAALAARAAAAENEWEQVTEVYRSVAEWRQARQLVATLRDERVVQDSVAKLAEARFEGGTLTRLELSRTAGEQRTAVAAEQAAVRDEIMARASLARVLGLPAPIDVELAEIPVPECPAGSRDTLQRIALASRWLVRRAAAEYQVAEGDLRLEAANATPDLTLGPGLFFDQGTGKFTLGLGLPALLLNRNRGPIGEAEARRAAAGARLMRAQETVLAEVDAALVGCQNAATQAEATDSVSREAERRLLLVQSAYGRGETGRLEVIAAKLELVRVHRANIEARFRQNQATLSLERAVGAYGTRTDGSWPATAN